jgi:hypothetical protein
MRGSKKTNIVAMLQTGGVGGDLAFPGGDSVVFLLTRFLDTKRVPFR